jgi:hypothetical protein
MKGLSRITASSESVESSSITVTGGATPIFDRDAEGNTLFWDYYLNAKSVTLN